MIRVEDNKKWYESKTILASLVTVIALIAGMFNLAIDTETQQGIVELATVIVGVFGSTTAIWARIKANKTIK